MRAFGVAMASLLLCSTAWAQHGDPVGQAGGQRPDWTDPLGRFSLNYEDNGWSVASDPAATEVLSLTHRRFRMLEGRERDCSVTETPVTTSVTGEIEQDAWLEGLTSADVEGIVRRPVSDFSHTRAP